MTPPSDLADLEQIMKTVGIPAVHVIANHEVGASQQQNTTVTADSEEINFLSMSLIISDDDSHTSDTLQTSSQIAAVPITKQNIVSVRPLLAVSRDKDIKNLREQYSPPEPLGWSSEHSSLEATPSSSRTSYFPHSSTSQFDASETEPSSSSVSRNRSRSRSPRPAAAEQGKAQEPFQMNDWTDNFEWQLLHGRVRVGSATNQEVDRFVHLDQSLRSQLEGVVNDPADMSHEELLEYFHSFYSVIMTTARARRTSRCPPGEVTVQNKTYACGIWNC